MPQVTKRDISLLSIVAAVIGGLAIYAAIPVHRPNMESPVNSVQTVTPDDLAIYAAVNAYIVNLDGKGTHCEPQTVRTGRYYQFKITNLESSLTDCPPPKSADPFEWFHYGVQERDCRGEVSRIEEIEAALDKRNQVSVTIPVPIAKNGETNPGDVISVSLPVYTTDGNTAYLYVCDVLHECHRRGSAWTAEGMKLPNLDPNLIRPSL